MLKSLIIYWTQVAGGHYFVPCSTVGWSGAVEPPFINTMSVTNIQESFFHAFLRGNNHFPVHLLTGINLPGRVRSFNKSSVVLETKFLEKLFLNPSFPAAVFCIKKQCWNFYPQAPTPA